MQRLGFPLYGLIVFGGVALALAALVAAGNSPEEKIASPASLQPSAARHETRTGLQEVIEFPNANEIAPRVETIAPRSGGYSNVTTVTMQPSTGLTIQATFDSSITGDPNAAAIEAMINRAIAIYESLFSDPITINILFRYSTTGPEPSATPYPAGVLATSLSTVYTVSWNSFISALRADATTNNDNTANASLPGSALATNIEPSSGNGRSVGLNTPPAMFADGHIGTGGPFDGIVTLVSAVPYSFTRPLFAGSFDAQRSTEHEVDEVIGLGSYLNTPSAPAPCPSYEAESPICPPNPPPGEQCSILAGGAVIQSCPLCSGGEDVGFVGNNSGTLQFNGITANASGVLDIKIWYANGDAVRYAFMSVNGGSGTPLSFPSTGSFQTPGSIETTLTGLIPGSNNTIKFSNPIVGDWAPDFDRIEVNCTIPPPTTLRPQDLFSWSSHNVRNLTLDGSRYFSIDSGSTDIVGFNQTAPGDFGDWLSEACPQPDPRVQNAFACPDQFSDISATSPEGINLDVIGYDLASASTATPTPPPTPTGTPPHTPTPTPTPRPTPTPTPTSTPTPCYPNFTTAEGCDALLSLTTGSGNTALGWRALVVNTIGNFNTGVGGGALALNTMDSNTAVGTATLLLNSRGTQNTAVGTSALLFNGSGDVSGDFNTATGYSALMNNLTGGSNTAIGWEALTANIDGLENVALGTVSLSSNTSGFNNTSIGTSALENCVSTSRHVAVGTGAGSGITIVDDNIVIGHHSGVHSRFGQEDHVCYIGNIYGANVDNFGSVARMVRVDPDGRLGTVPIDTATPTPTPSGGKPGKSPGIQPQAVPDGAKQTMLNLELQNLEATISQQQSQIERLTAQVKEQIEQIHKVNARLEMNKPTSQIIVNKTKAVP